MAKDNNTVDELRLDISVTDDENSEQKVNELASAIVRLKKVVADFSKQGSKINSADIQKSFEKTAQSVKKATSDGTVPIKKENKTLGINIAEINTETDLWRAQLQKVNDELKSENLLLEKSLSLSKQKLSLENKIDESPELKKPTKVEEDIHIKLPTEKPASGLTEINTETDLWRAQLQKVNDELAITGLSEDKILSLTKQKLSLEKKITDSQKRQSVFGKGNLLSSIGRVATYRAIRTVLKSITDNLSEGFNGIALQNEEFSKSMSELQSSTKQLGASLAIVLYQPLVMLAPIIENISNAFVAFFNRVSIGMAALRGQAQAVQVNTEYWEDYKDSIDEAKGTLLSFDTFTTLANNKSSSQFDYDKIFQSVDIETIDVGQLNSDLATTRTLLFGIGVALGVITAIKIIDGITSLVGLFKDFSNVTKTAKNITTVGKSLKDTAKNAGSLTKDIGLLAGGLAIAGIGISDLVASWEDANFEGWEKGVVIATAALSGLAVAALAVHAGLSPMTAIAATAAVVGAVTLLGTELAKATKVKKYADGGMFEGAGTMYALAGERGAEVVAHGSAGTGVLNVQQFKDAMFMALYEYGAARGDFHDIRVTMDNRQVGKLVARSSYEEMNRQGLLKKNG